MDLKIADIVFRIHGSESILATAAGLFRRFIVHPEKADFTVDLQELRKKTADRGINVPNNHSYRVEIRDWKMEVDLDREVCRAWISETNAYQILRTLFRNLVLVLSLRRNALVLHASACRVNSGIVFFSGPSGAGKSTVLETIKRDVEPVLDDMVVLGKAIGTWHALCAPDWSGKYRGLAEPVLLCAGFILARSPQSVVTDLSVCEQLRGLINVPDTFARLIDVEALISGMNDMVRSTSCRRLGFHPDTLCFSDVSEYF